MARDYAAAALVRAGKRADKEIPGCTFAGVLGDSAHTYGYHRGRSVLPKSDYSVILPLDRKGPGNAASALDLSFTASQMKVVTARLRKSALDPEDSRLECVREFYGTLNGKSVFGLTKNGLNTEWGSASSDSSHLWHVHISFFRAFCENDTAANGVIDVLAGKPYKKTSGNSTKGKEMTLKDVVKLVTGGKVKYSSKTTTVEGILASTNYYVLEVRNVVNELNERVKKLEEKA